MNLSTVESHPESDEENILTEPMIIRGTTFANGKRDQFYAIMYSKDDGYYYAFRYSTKKRNNYHMIELDNVVYYYNSIPLKKWSVVDTLATTTYTMEEFLEKVATDQKKQKMKPIELTKEEYGLMHKLMFHWLANTNETEKKGRPFMYPRNEHDLGEDYRSVCTAQFGDGPCFLQHAKGCRWSAPDSKCFRDLRLFPDNHQSTTSNSSLEYCQQLRSKNPRIPTYFCSVLRYIEQELEHVREAAEDTSQQLDRIGTAEEYHVLLDNIIETFVDDEDRDDRLPQVSQYMKLDIAHRLLRRIESVLIRNRQQLVQQLRVFDEDAVDDDDTISMLRTVAFQGLDNFIDVEAYNSDAALPEQHLSQYSVDRVESILTALLDFPEYFDDPSDVQDVLDMLEQILLDHSIHTFQDLRSILVSLPEHAHFWEDVEVYMQVQEKMLYPGTSD